MESEVAVITDFLVYLAQICASTCANDFLFIKEY